MISMFNFVNYFVFVRKNNKISEYLLGVTFLQNNTIHPKRDFLTKSICQMLAHLENTNIIVNKLIL